MPWHYIAVRDADGDYWLHENFPEKGCTETPVTVCGESVAALAEMLRKAADDVERFAPKEATNET